MYYLKKMFIIICISKNTLYICLYQNGKNMKTTIQTTDFTDNTLQLFNEAKEKNSFLLTWDLVRLLIDNDYPVKDVKQFIKANFSHYKFLDYSI